MLGDESHRDLGATLSTLTPELAPDDGVVTVDGLDPNHQQERIEIRRRLGHLPQHIGVVEGARAFDTVEYMAVLEGVDDDRLRRATVFAVVERVGLRDRANDASSASRAACSVVSGSLRPCSGRPAGWCSTSPVPASTPKNDCGCATSSPSGG